MRYIYGSANYAILDVVKKASTSDATAQGIQITSGGFWQGRTFGDSYMSIYGRVVARTSGAQSFAYKRSDLWIPSSGPPVILGVTANVDGKADVDGIGILAGGGLLLGYTIDIFWNFTGIAATTINWKAHFAIHVSKGPAAP